MKLFITSSPHIRETRDTSNVMFHVLIALLPSTLCALYFFGQSAFITIAISILSAISVEAIINRIRKQPLTIGDGSAAVTGLLFALVLPPVIPIWMVILGNIVAIGIVKHAFGGLGHNIFNPALTARLFLAVSYPVTLTTWYEPASWFSFRVSQAVTTATPLSHSVTATPDLWSLALGSVSGCIGETSAIAILIGAAWLFYQRIINWKIPGSFLITIILVSLLLGQSPLFHLLSGGIMLGAFFMLTDYVTSPITAFGRIFFGCLTAILVMMVRVFSNMPEGVAFSIVLMNAFVPLLDRLGIYLQLRIRAFIFRSQA